jgi:hypothetical protein
VIRTILDLAKTTNGFYGGAEAEARRFFRRAAVA